MKENPICIIMIGPAGCGKSTKAKEFAAAGFQVISSDQIRKEKLGAESIQTDPRPIFDEVKRRTIHHLNHGNDAVIDATNLNIDERNGLIKDLRKLTIPAVNPVFIGISFKDISLLQCLIQNEKRNRHVPERVIAKHFLRMQDNIPIEKGIGLDALILSKEATPKLVSNMATQLVPETEKEEEPER